MEKLCPSYDSHVTSVGFNTTLYCWRRRGKENKGEKWLRIQGDSVKSLFLLVHVEVTVVVVVVLMVK